MSLQPTTLATIARIFDSLDYASLGTIYCHEGGDAFWEERRGPCQELGIKLATVLRGRLRPGGRSLYVGAGVAELPLLVMETAELHRMVVAYTLRANEAAVLNRACAGLPFEFQGKDAREAGGPFDHLWIVSVLNDPECFPELGALSSGRANPVTFDPAAFTVERQAVLALAARCLEKIAHPALVTTSLEEIPWITDWCERHGVPYMVEDEDYPTAIVQDPICFIRLGESSR
jgi:hypothetical protein